MVSASTMTADAGYIVAMAQTVAESKRRYRFQKGRSGNPGGNALNGAMYQKLYAELAADIGNDGAGELTAAEQALLRQVALSFVRSERMARDVLGATRAANAGARILASLREMRRERVRERYVPLRERLLAEMEAEQAAE